MISTKKIIFQNLHTLSHAVLEVGIPEPEKKVGLSKENPNDYWVVLGGLADQYEDEGNYEEAEFFRWCLENKQMPYIDTEDTEDGAWFRKKVVNEKNEEVVSGVGPDLEDEESNLDSNYFEQLPGEMVANHKRYTDFYEAYSALYVAYMKVNHKEKVEFEKEKFGTVLKVVKSKEDKEEKKEDDK